MAKLPHFKQNSRQSFEPCFLVAVEPHFKGRLWDSYTLRSALQLQITARPTPSLKSSNNFGAMIFGKLVARLAKGPFMKDVLKIFRE